jgi:hypothetical protein
MKKLLDKFNDLTPVEKNCYVASAAIFATAVLVAVFG